MGILLVTYGVLTAIGGVIGSARAKSRASLISGLGSGIVLIASGGFVLMGDRQGGYLGLLVTVLLTVVFAIRFAKTRAFMPSGLMLALSVLVTAALAVMLWI